MLPTAVNKVHRHLPAVSQWDASQARDIWKPAVVTYRLDNLKQGNHSVTLTGAERAGDKMQCSFVGETVGR